MRHSFLHGAIIITLASTHGRAWPDRPRHGGRLACTTPPFFTTRSALAEALRRVLDAGIPLDGASDHVFSEALYLRDPDDNGVELYWDRPPAMWPRSPAGELEMFSRRLDLNALLSAIEVGRSVPDVNEWPADL